MNVERDIDALLAFIASRAGKRFDWRGSRDCVAFAARAVRAQTGVDPRGDLRWRSRRAARAIVLAEGGLEAAIDRRLARVAPARAQRGDIAAVRGAEFGIALMVVEGQTLVGPAHRGVERLPRSAMTMAWDAMSAGRLLSTDE